MRIRSGMRTTIRCPKRDCKHNLGGICTKTDISLQLLPVPRDEREAELICWGYDGGSDED